ncbi:MAG TPA: MFS transporter, partial [Candidatus Acidoferrum sp.]|nr:MFS transporter [Candidatus Acidoferrum sp.]
LSHWFTPRDRARATSNFMAAIPVSFVIGSPIAGWILGHRWFAIEGWRWLFLLEGMPAILLGIVAFFYLTDWPREATWLAPEQQKLIGKNLSDEQPHNAQAISIRQALRSGTVLLLAAVTFLNYFESYSFFFWFPTMLKRQSGFSDVNVGLLGAVPYLVLFIAMQVNGLLSDRSHERHWHSAVPLFIAAAGFLGLITQPRSIPLSLSLSLFTMACMGSAYLPVFWAIPGEILSKSTAAVAIGMINAVGSVAGFASPYLFGYLNTRTGSFSAGLSVLMVSALAGGLLILFTPRSA